MSLVKNGMIFIKNLPTVRKEEKMNFEKMNDRIIGMRIKRFRGSLELTQEKFCDEYETKISIDKYRLSALENGKRDKRKNPHFLTENFIEFFTQEMNIGVSDFLFGNRNERMFLIKLVVLNILMNGSIQTPDTRDIPKEQNPIFDLDASDSDFFRLAYLNFDSLDDSEKEYHKIAYSVYFNIDAPDFDKDVRDMKRKVLSEKLKSYDPFFFNSDSAKFYESLMDGSKQFIEQSSLILRALFGNFQFASDFLTRTDNTENYVFGGLELRDTNRTEFFLDDYLEKKGNLSAMVIDWKEVSYRKFIIAFNEFFSKYSNDFYYFFEEHVFNEPIKKLKNSYMNNLFRSREFTEFLMNIEFLDQFEEERMTGHNFTHAAIQKFTLIKRNSEKLLKKGIELPTYRKIGDDVYDLSLDSTNSNEYNLSKYLYDFENMTVLYANGDKYKDFSAGLHLPSYFDIEIIK